MVDDREEWEKARDAMKATLKPLLEAEGLKVPKALLSANDFWGDGAEVELTYKGRYGFNTLVAKVKPSWDLGSRPSIFYQKVRDMTPEASDVLVQKVVRKVREFQEAKTRKDKREAEWEVAAAQTGKRIDEFMRVRFPEFKNVYGSTFELKDGDVDVRLEAHVEGEDVTFKVRVDEYVTAEEAREVVDFFARLEARRMPQDTRA